MIAVAAIAVTAGRRWTRCTHRSQKPGLVSVRVAGRLASSHLADPPADQAEERGQQGERRREYEHDADRGCDRGAVEQAHAEREHPEQRDHDGGAGEQNGAAGGVERRLDGLLHVAAVACGSSRESA